MTWQSGESWGKDQTFTSILISTVIDRETDSTLAILPSHSIRIRASLSQKTIIIIQAKRYDFVLELKAPPHSAKNLKIQSYKTCHQQRPFPGHILTNFTLNSEWERERPNSTTSLISWLLVQTFFVTLAQGDLWNRISEIAPRLKGLNSQLSALLHSQHSDSQSSWVSCAY